MNEAYSVHLSARQARSSPASARRDTASFPIPRASIFRLDVRHCQKSLSEDGVTRGRGGGRVAGGGGVRGRGEGHRVAEVKANRMKQATR